MFKPIFTNIKDKEFQKRMKEGLHELLLENPLDIKVLAEKIGISRGSLDRFLLHEESTLNPKNAYKILGYLQQHFSDF